MKHKWIIKLVREVLGYVTLGSALLLTIVVMSKNQSLGALGGGIITGTLSGIVAIALNQKEPKDQIKGINNEK